MSQIIPIFSDVVDAADRLSRDEKVALIEILNRRLSDEGRRRVIEDAHQAGKDYEAGLCKEVTVEELMREIRS
ncbi:MAG TPA: hypothetical protein VGI75_11350 [Pirellulales bacterium]|jgi:hypothetical protein